MHEIDKIINAGNCELVIKWKDGKSQALKADYLESLCPCVDCQGVKKEALVDVKILSFIVKGRFGVKLEFSQGCSKGIYSFQQIRSWLKK